MVNVQVWWNEIQDGGKIASYSCGEKDVEQVVADFESDYGAVKHICLEDGVVYGIKGNKKYGFKLFADNHFLLIRTTEGQMERLMEKIVTDEFEDRIVDGYHCKGSYDRKTEGSETMTEKTERMNFDELKAVAQQQAENVAEWKQTNANIRKELKRKGVKCRTAFYNPQDHKAYIKQTFRKVKLEGVEQIENTWEDVLFFVCDGDERQIQGYWDGEYIAIDVHLLLEDFETETEAEDEECIVDDKSVVEFECEYGSASLSGYVYYCEIGDDAPLHFYDDNGFETSILPISQDSDNEDETKLYIAFVEDLQFLQFLSDCAERSATIRREGYVLHINGGEQFSLTFEKVGNFSTDSCDATYDVRIIPSTDISLDGDLLDDLASRVGQTWNGDARVEDGFIICEFDKHFFDEDSDFSDVVDEMTQDYECLYKQQLTRNLGANGSYQLSLVDKFAREGDSRVYDDALIRESASVFETQLEELDWRQLRYLTDDELQKMVYEDIEESFNAGG